MAQTLYQLPVTGLSASLQKGYIPIPLGSWRILAASVTTNIAVASGNGGQLALDTAPILERVNGATDKKLRLRWVASNVTEIVANIEYPPDLDDLSPVVIHLLMAMSGATDVPTIAVAYFEGLGDANAGGNTAALSSSIVDRTVTIAAGDVGPAPAAASIALVPAAHGTDAIHFYGAWAEYTRKS